MGKMTEIVQRTYAVVLNSLGKIFTRLGKKNKRNVIWLIFVLIFMEFLFFSDDTLLWWGVPHIHLYTNIFCSIMLILTSLLSIKGKLQPVKWRNKLFILMELCGLGLIITGIMHPIGDGYMSFGIMLLSVYPCLYFVWTNRGDYDTLFETISKAFLMVSIVYFVISSIDGFAEGTIAERNRFSGTMRNSNIYSMIGMVMTAAALYLLYLYLYSKRRNMVMTAYGTLGIVIGFTMMMLGQSRACIAASIVNCIITVSFAVKHITAGHGSRTWRRGLSTKRAAALFLIVVIVAAAGIAVLNRDSGDTEADGTSKKGVWYERFLPGEKSLNRYTSGRINIWKSYASHLNLSGNNFDETDWDELTNHSVGHAHNNFLEYGYRCGVPVALLFTILELLAGLIILRYMFYDSDWRPGYLFAAMFMVIYVIESLFDVATIPMERYAPFFFYLMLMIMMDTETAELNHPQQSGRRPKEFQKRSEQPRMICRDINNLE